MTPLFSIITPTFNRPLLLRRALESIAAQTFSSYEVVVVDDHSPTAVAIPEDVDLREYRLIRHDTNRGPAASYNSGIAAARGSLITILDDDDEYEPDFLARTAEAMERDPAAEWAWTSIKVVDHGMDGALSRPVERRFPEVHASTEDMFLDALSIGNGFGFTVRAECYARVGSYDEGFPVAEDAEFIYRLLAAGARPVVIPDPLVTIHNHAGIRRTDACHDAARLNDCLRIRDRHREFIDRWPRVADQLDHVISLLRASANQDAKT